MNHSAAVFSVSPPSEAASLLAIERTEIETGENLHADSHREYTDCGCRISHAVFDGIHSYHTLITGQLWLLGKEEHRRHRAALRKIILGYLSKSHFCLRSGKVLFCGLGNERITADALGPMTAERLYAGGRDPVYRAAGFTELYVLKPGVPSQSGMGTGEHIRTVAKHLGADLIITADASAARTVKRLASVVQVTDGGVRAGSGTGASSDEISSITMPCPVLSICTPTVIRASLLSADESTPPFEREDFLVSRSDTDLICQCYADLISSSINSIFSAPLCGE